MDQNKLTLEKAQLLLVENFLVWRHMPKSFALELLEKIKETLTTPARDFMILKGIFKSKKAAFIHVNVLGVLLNELVEKAKTQPLIETDCKYIVSPDLREEIEIEWGVCLAETEAEVSYYL